MKASSAKSIDSGQPVQSAQADLGRNFLLLVCIFSVCQKTITHKQGWFS